MSFGSPGTTVTGPTTGFSLEWCMLLCVKVHVDRMLKNAKNDWGLLKTQVDFLKILMHMGRQSSTREKTNTLAYVFQPMSLCNQNTHNQMQWGQKGPGVVMAAGNFSWSSDARWIPIPVSWPKSQETHTGNGVTQQDCNVSAKKTTKPNTAECTRLMVYCVLTYLFCVNWSP